MIEINLLPEELRPKEQKQTFLPQILFYVLPAAFGLLVIIQLCLGCVLLVKTLQYRSLNKKYEQFNSQRHKVDAWKKQHTVSNQQIEQISKFLAQRITVSDKMQVLTQVLPNGIWFNYLKLEQKKFNLTGSVVSLNKDQMRLLNLFLGRLKKDNLFFKDFTRLELGRMSMRTLGAFSIMDFALEGDLR